MDRMTSFLDNSRRFVFLLRRGKNCRDVSEEKRERVFLSMESDGDLVTVGKRDHRNVVIVSFDSRFHRRIW